MNLWTSTGLLAGGLGLFLLGMGMMTDGLKLVAGPALRNVLTQATRTRWHALGTGVMVTAMVQSSSAVTVAAIGFVNAGLLPLAPALWVMFGTNVGTTMTGWIVALIGLRFKIDVLALPLVGLGMLLRLSGEGQRRGALGTSLAGFGLLFLGIATLQQAFAGLAATVQLPQGTGPLSVLAQVGIGLTMTVLVQSSSASIAIALTAAQGGMLTEQGAAAVVIGANIGTTVTALLAAIGATPNAQRAATAHVVFNLLTGVVALALLPWWIPLLDTVRDGLNLTAGPASVTALFHTTFNLVGVLLMWPLADTLTHWLQRRFRPREQEQARPRYLDDSLLSVPTLALDALGREVDRFGALCVEQAEAVLQGAQPASMNRRQQVIGQLDAAVEAFVERIGRATLSPPSAARLAALLRIQHYHGNCAELALAAAPLTPPDTTDPQPLLAHRRFVSTARQLLAEHNPVNPPGTGSAPIDLRPMEESYQELKAAVLAAAAASNWPLMEMETALERYSAMHRALQQAAKAQRARGNGA